MKKITVQTTGMFNVNESIPAEMLEVKIEKMMAQEEPIVASMAYEQTERKDGVKPEYDIRTNRWEIAHEIMSKGATAHDKGRDFRRSGMEVKNENEASSDIITTDL